MRLIDADELKKCAIPCEIHHGALTDLCVPLYQIDNAPTVEVRIDPNDIYYLCDHKSCGENFNCYECNHTSDIRHAVNFDLVEFPRSAFYEIDRPHGEWLHPYKVDIACECSNCRMQMPITSYFNFCPNCGADMREEGDT